MDITFNCGKCGQHIAIDEVGVGQLVDCPKCGTPIEVPYKSRPAATAGIPAPRPVTAVPPEQRMNIKFKCDKCRLSLFASEAEAGSVMKCPYCDVSLTVPNLPKAASTSLPPKIITAGQTKSCPFCSEMILSSAIKCKHCGEFLDGKSRGQYIVPAPQSYHQPTPAKAEPVNNGNIAAVYALAIFFPFIGFFYGIYLLAKKEPGHGVSCVAISIFSFFIWYAILTS